MSLITSPKYVYQTQTTLIIDYAKYADFINTKSFINKNAYQT